MGFIDRIWHRVRDRLRPPSCLQIRFPSESDLLGGISAEILATASIGSKHDLVRYYRGRLTPHFFICPQEIAAAIHTIEAEFPAWRTHLLRKSADWCAAYDTAHGTEIGRGGMIAWGALPTGPGHDHIYRDRVHLFSFAPALALASLFGAPTRSELQTNFQSWMNRVEQEPNPAAYSSCLIVAYRIVAISWVLAFLAAEQSEDVELEFMLLRILLNEGRFLSARLGTSFANNHLLGDAFALWYLGALFPEFAEAADWKMRGEEVWLHQFSRQVYEDGTSFEHSMHYHELVCEMATAYVLLHRRNDWNLPDWVMQRTERMLAFKAEVSGADATPLPLGDAIEDPLFPLEGGDGWGCAAYYEIYRALFHPDLAAVNRAHPGVERAFWLLGGKLPEIGASLHRDKFSAYPEGGYFLFSDRSNRGRLFFRSGPSPDKDLNPGHMHADLLSVYLHIDNQPLIVEAGTYTYRSKIRNWPDGTPAWRAHFLSPRSHNGLYLENQDSLGRGGGDFPGKPVQSRSVTGITISTEKFAWAAACITGQTAYSGHCRGVVHIIGHYWLIYDVLPDAAFSKPASLGFQLAADAVVAEQHEQAIFAKAGGTGVWIAGSNGLSAPKCAKGQLSPVEGWISSRYGKIQAATMVRYALTPQSEQRLVASLLLPGEESAKPPRVEVLVGHGSRAFRITYQDKADYLVLSEQGGETVLPCGIRFTGKMMWLQTSHGKPTGLIWHDGSQLDWPEVALQIRGFCSNLEIQTTSGVPHVAACPDISISWPGYHACTSSP